MKVGDLVRLLWCGDDMLGLILDWVNPQTPGFEGLVHENTWLIELVNNGEKTHRAHWELELVSESR